MPQEQYHNEKIEDEIKAGRPERYFDYISKTYGATFQTGTAEALELFASCYDRSSRSETHAARSLR
jgi:hypothetical protein